MDSGTTEVLPVVAATMDALRSKQKAFSNSSAYDILVWTEYIVSDRIQRGVYRSGLWVWDIKVIFLHVLTPWLALHRTPDVENQFCLLVMQQYQLH